MTKRSASGVVWSTPPTYKLFNDTEIIEACNHMAPFVRVIRRAGRRNNEEYNDIIVGADTETSKTREDVFANGDYVPNDNIVVAWTISVRCEAGNICTIYGAKPSRFVECLRIMHESMPAKMTQVFFHFLSYDWTFLELFFFSAFGHPKSQLNTKAHYPVRIEFDNGIILRDSLIIAQKTLERWGEELMIQHTKSVGKWDYEALRSQSGQFTADELEYIEHDTLALVECLDTLRAQLHKHVYSIPLTCTSIVREAVRTEGRKNRAHNRFLRMAPKYDLYKKFVQMYHGGYTHNNRHTEGWIISDVTCYDIASSYPTRMLIDKMPMERFRNIPDNVSAQTILDNSSDTAWCFTLYAVGVHLKDRREPMPVLQLSKCLHTVNADTDNGRILDADIVEIVLNEIDLSLIMEQYTFDHHVCHDVWCASKGYLPRWLRDFVYNCFVDKCQLKGGDDPVAYTLAKIKINSIYGLVCQKPCKELIIEDYDNGAYVVKRYADDPLENMRLTEEHDRAEYEKYLESPNSVLPYFWGCWVTSTAMLALHRLGGCVYKKNINGAGVSDGMWLYCDTDSVYSNKWDESKLAEYNAEIKTRMLAQGYGAVHANGKEYWCGVAEFDGHYKEFVGLHAKCYAVKKDDDSIKITVAGVPKSGANCLHDLSEFEDGFVFDGKTTGKLTHFYIYRNQIEVRDGIEYGNSIDLHACDYKISMPTIDDLEDIISKKEQEINLYGNEKLLLQH